MKICEDCIKQDVCKFKGNVEKFEEKEKLPEPLSNGIICKYKKFETVNCPSVWTTGTYTYPDQWDYTYVNPDQWVESYV